MGTIQPLREITGGNTGFTNTPRVASLQSNEFFTGLENAEVRSFRELDDGNIQPIDVLSGGNTGLTAGEQTSLDEHASDLYVVDTTGAAIRVYFSLVLGDQPPKRTISGPNTGLIRPVDVVVAAD